MRAVSSRGGVVSPEIRALAYKERRVGDAESASLESFCTSILQHVIIVAPHSVPHKGYMTLLRECVPELGTVTVPHDLNLFIVSPASDTLSPIASKFSRWLSGSILETIQFEGPAFRSLPKAPRKLFQLGLKSRQAEKLPEVAEGQPPRFIVEVASGASAVASDLLRVVFDVSAYVSHPSLDDAAPSQGDLRRPAAT